MMEKMDFAEVMKAANWYDATRSHLFADKGKSDRVYSIKHHINREAEAMLDVSLGATHPRGESFKDRKDAEKLQKFLDGLKWAKVLK